VADSIYELKEFHATIVDEEKSEIYIRISNANDFMPIAGWYKKTIPASQGALPAIEEAMENQSYLSGADWTREAPPGDSRESTIDDILKMLEELHPGAFNIMLRDRDTTEQGHHVLAVIYGLAQAIKSMK
jgi:hypothetical protein